MKELVLLILKRSLPKRVEEDNQGDKNQLTQIHLESDH